MLASIPLSTASKLQACFELVFWSRTSTNVDILSWMLNKHRNVRRLSLPNSSYPVIRMGKRRKTMRNTSRIAYNAAKNRHLQNPNPESRLLGGPCISTHSTQLRDTSIYSFASLISRIIRVLSTLRFTHISEFTFLLTTYIRRVTFISSFPTFLPEAVKMKINNLSQLSLRRQI
jgi:hypothetical protein